MERMNMQIIFYGAGEYGREMLDFMYYMHLEDIVIGFCDKNASSLQCIKEKTVYSLEEAEKLNVPLVITIAKREIREEVEKELKDKNIPYYSNVTEWVNGSNIDVVNWGREFCAFFHKKGMDKYFENAEGKEAIEAFWGKDTEFYKMFCQSITKKQLNQLSELNWIDGIYNLILSGPPGVGQHASNFSVIL